MVIDEVAGIGETVRELLENPNQLPSKKARETSRDKLISECEGYAASKLFFSTELPSDCYYG